MARERTSTHDTLTEAVDLVGQAIVTGATPGAAVVIGRHDTVLLERALGCLSYVDDAPPVTFETVYDLASLTKVIVTTPLAMHFYERGALDLHAPVTDYLDAFRGGDKERVRIEDLLAHSGGLLWWTELYKQFEGCPPAEAKRSYIEVICSMPLDYAPRSKTVYSDLGFLLLGEVLERIGGAPLDALATEHIFQPLGMSETTFRPTPTEQIAPTEEDEWRGRLIRGEVHDENAFGLGGVAPHAGVFSTARGLVPFAQMLLSGGVYHERRLFDAATIERFTHRANLVEGSSRALGWDTPGDASSCGRRFSASSFGHTGFTGTSLWLDPERDVFVILLTNRVHPTRENEQIRGLRPAFHDAVMAALTL